MDITNDGICKPYNLHVPITTTLIPIRTQSHNALSIFRLVMSVGFVFRSKGEI